MIYIVHPIQALQTSHNIYHNKWDLINSIVQRPWPQLKKKPINLHLNGGPCTIHFFKGEQKGVSPYLHFYLARFALLRQKRKEKKKNKTADHCKCGSCLGPLWSVLCPATDFSFMKIILEKKNDKVSFVLVWIFGHLAVRYFDICFQ